MLSDAESRMMSILWDKGRATVQQICDSHEKKVAYTTVATILAILEKKEYVTHEVEGRTYVYQPLVSRDEVGQSTLQYIVNRLFKGSYQRLVANLVDSGRLSKENLAELNKMLQAAEEKKAKDDHA